MDFRLQRISDGYIDALGNRFDFNENDRMALETELAPLDACFSFDEYQRLTNSDNTNMDDVELDNGDEIDVDVDAAEDIDVDKPIKKTRGEYNRYSESQKQRFWQMVAEEGFSAYKAALLNDINLQTAYTWKKNWNRKIVDEQNGIFHTPKKRGRKPLLTDEHREFLKNLVNEDATVTLAFLLEKLREAFDDVKASVSTIYNFITRICKFSLKRVSKWALRRSLDDVKEKRCEWAEEYKEKLDFNKNCVFIDEAGFNISMRREYGWSAVGEKAVIKVPVTRGLNVTFIGAICAKGCIDLRVRNPANMATNKKRKIDSDTSVVESSGRGTTANHFYSFIKSVLNQINKHEELKGMKYLVLDNAAIHKRRDIQLLVAESGLELVFLPPYSPGLNAIEEFWSVCKSKVKRSALNKKEQLTPKVMEATSKISADSYGGFCRHAGDHVQLCLDKEEF